MEIGTVMHSDIQFFPAIFFVLSLAMHLFLGSMPFRSHEYNWDVFSADESTMVASGGIYRVAK
jgi:hypothetical protein